jgi:hypothetical protein
MNLLKVHPAYGRRYTSPDVVKQEFLNGRDFSITLQGSPYVSIFEFLDNDKSVVPFDGILFVQVVPTFMSIVILRKDMVPPQRTCECGADLRAGEITCHSCKQKYKEEA